MKASQSIKSENNKTLEASEHRLRTKRFYIFTIKRFMCSKDTLLMSLCPLIDFPFLNCPVYNSTSTVVDGGKKMLTNTLFEENVTRSVA